MSHAESSQLEGNPFEAVKFLQLVHPNGPWALTCIENETRRIETRTFAPNEIEEVHEWLAKWMPSRNIYYHCNSVAERLASKATKDDIREVRFLHVDVDPRAGESAAAERTRIFNALNDPPDGIPMPTHIVDSGGGYQALWQLEAPLNVEGDRAKAAEAERFNRKLELSFSADACHNIDRLLRLPGTVNRPDAKKRAKGRVEALASQVAGSGGAVSINLFKQAPPVSCAGGGGSASVVDGGAAINCELEDLPGDIPDQIKVLIVQGADPDDPGKYPSRSEAVFHVSCELARRGIEKASIAGILLNENYAISASIREKRGRAEAYALRQAERAYERAVDEYEESDGKRRPTWKNVRIALGRLGIAVRHNEFSGLDHVEGLPDFGPLLDDHALRRLRGIVVEQERVKLPKEEFLDAVKDIAQRDRFHPVRDYIESLRWDGRERLDRLFIDYAGADDTSLTRAITRAHMVAAIRRIRSPGTKHDEILILEGTEGKDKSSALEILAVEPQWFTDNLPLNARQPRELMEAIGGHWIIECADLAGMAGARGNSVKALLSRSVDKDRRVYDRLVSIAPRQCVFFGTSNDQQYLRGNSGNRRFWPIRVEKFDLEALRRDREQLWAEAAALEARGEPNRLDPSLWAAAADEQAMRRVSDPWTDVLDGHFGDLTGSISSRDVWQILGVPVDQRRQEHNERMGASMAQLGFVKTKARFVRGNKPEYGYARGSSESERLRRIKVRIDPSTNAVEVSGEGPEQKEMLRD